MPHTRQLEEVKRSLIAELEKRVSEKIIEKNNKELLEKLINAAESESEALAIAALGTTYKRTGFHFDKRLEVMEGKIHYLKRNENLSFAPLSEVDSKAQVKSTNKGDSKILQEVETQNLESKQTIQEAKAQAESTNNKQEIRAEVAKKEAQAVEMRNRGFTKETAAKPCFQGGGEGSYLKGNDRADNAESAIYRSNATPITHTLIIGDNYPALLNLLITYKKKVKVIYIDPPYGKDDLGEFAHTNYDNAITRDNLLSMLYPRLILARELLRDDGVIFCSIDDKNQAYIKCLFDEVFGERNFLGDFIRKTKSTTNDAKTGLNYQHEFLLCYAKDRTNASLLGGQKDLSKYQNPDNDPNGRWVIADPSAKSGDMKTGYFAVKNPYTGKEDYPPEGRFWLFSQNTMERHIDEGRICFKKEHKEGERGFIYKRYLKDLKTDLKTFDSLKFADNAFMNQVATKEAKDIGFVEYFAYPKPIEFVKEILKHATTNPSDYMESTYHTEAVHSATEVSQNITRDISHSLNITSNTESTQMAGGGGQLSPHSLESSEKAESSHIARDCHDFDKQKSRNDKRLDSQAQAESANKGDSKILQENVEMQNLDSKQAMQEAKAKVESAIKEHSSILDEKCGLQEKVQGSLLNINDRRTFSPLPHLSPKDECEIVLDFFAGSGTTCHALMELNREDGGTRKAILVTNNEITAINPNGIAKDVTTKRLKRVMSGSCYDGSTDFKWLEKNTPYGDGLEVYEIQEVSNSENAEGQSAFEVIDERAYGKDFDNAYDKIKWVCESFSGTQKLLKVKDELGHIGQAGQEYSEKEYERGIKEFLSTLDSVNALAKKGQK